MNVEKTGLTRQHEQMNIAYDCETYPNVFTLCAEDCHSPLTWQFQISPWHDDSKDIIQFVHWIASERGRMVGFNNVGFDYPILHALIRMGRAGAKDLYDLAMRIIHSENKFEHMVFPSDRFCEQLDLFKIHHFDNKARSTSLKALEFNMQMDNISDLPFPVGTELNEQQTQVLLKYNAHDVKATKRFYLESFDMIRFREELTKKHSRDFMNHSDVKIGKEIFQMSLEKTGVQTYEYGPNGRQPKQTKRLSINLGECMPEGVILQHPEFARIQKHLASQTITETKGAFKDLIAHVGGLDFVFGTGGLHASVENEFFEANDDWMILDVDVTSLYPSIAITRGYYPEHLGRRFVDVYADLKNQRVSYKKGTAENAMLKLALNGVYGASGDQFSIFFDPKFTMQITIGGQMMIASLVERLLGVPDLRIVQCNTDGVTVFVKRCWLETLRSELVFWEDETGLQLEQVEYSKMAIRDVNNYVAVKLDGSTKRKGAYEYDKEWHQDQSALVVPKIAEKVLVDGAPIRETLMNWQDRMDFMQRVKVPRGSRLVIEQDGVDRPLENTQRYYVSEGGGRLFKIMPPLKGKTEWRRLGVEAGWTVCPCNDIRDAVLPINYEYYAKEIEKLCLGVM